MTSNRKIKIEIAEQTVIDVYGVTADDLADACAYPKTIINPEYVPAVGNPTIINSDYVPAVGDEFIYNENATEGELVPNPDYVPAVGEPEIPNPDYIPAVGELEIANPKTKLAFVAELILKAGLEELSKPYKRSQESEAVKQAAKAVEDKFVMGTAAVMNQAVIMLTE